MGINKSKRVRKKPKLGRAPESIPYTDDNMKHVAWCMNNSIVVGFSPIWDSEDDWTIDIKINNKSSVDPNTCLLYTSPSPRDGLLSRMPSSA